MRFDWDESKNRINRAKHGIDFAFARLAFDDPFAITIQDGDIDGETLPIDRCGLVASHSGGSCGCNIRTGGRRRDHQDHFGAKGNAPRKEEV